MHYSAARWRASTRAKSLAGNSPSLELAAPGILTPGCVARRDSPPRALRPQLEALDLAGRGLRQVGAEFDPARIFVGRERALHMLLQHLHKLGTGLVRRLEHDERRGLDQRVLVRPGNHR